MLVRDRVAAVILIAALMLTGCGAGSAPPAVSGSPTSTTTPDADDEAFRAAEATYRAYVDALNAVDLSDPATFEPVFALTTGKLNDETRATLAEMHSAGWRVEGQSHVQHLRAIRVDVLEVELAACLDVAAVRVLDQSGAVVTGEDRQPLQRLTVRTLRTGDSQFIAAVEPGDQENQC